MKILKIISLITVILNLNACATSSDMDFEQPNNDSGRILILGGEEFKEGEPWRLISWKCRDYSYGGSTLVEVGRASPPDDYKNTNEYKEIEDSKKEELDKFFSMIGFVLYDGTNTGDITLYNRDGLSHRWDWGAGERSYSFVIKPDGTGLFYDFSTAENGMKSKADDIYKCSR